MKPESWAYLLLRLGLGLNFFMLLIVRLPKYGSFADGIVGSFQGVLPALLVRPYALALPVVEGLIGLALILGLWTQWSALAGGAVMLSLLFGMTLQEQWDTVTNQLLYIALFAALIAFVRHERWSLKPSTTPARAA